jgi:hypothetical protein
MPEDSSASRLTKSRKLYHILWNAIDALYCQNSHESAPLRIFDLMSRIATCEQELEDWVVALPPSFRMDETSKEKATGYAADITTNLRTLLRLRYHGIRNLIHRPILERFLSMLGGSTDPTGKQANDFNHTLISCQHSLRLCATSSAEIMTLANSFNHAKMAPGMWWTTLYFGKLLI